MRLTIFVLASLVFATVGAWIVLRAARKHQVGWITRAQFRRMGAVGRLSFCGALLALVQLPCSLATLAAGKILGMVGDYQLSVQLKQGATAVLVFHNNTKVPLEITDVNNELWHICMSVIRPGSGDVNVYFANQYESATALTEWSRMAELQGLILSPGETVERQFAAGPTATTACAFDAEVVFAYSPRAAWEQVCFSAIVWLGLTKPKASVAIRFDGCEFSQVSGRIIEAERHSGVVDPALRHLLRKCLEVKYPDVLGSIRAQEDRDAEFVDEIRRRLQSVSFEALGVLLDRAASQLEQAKDDERASLCRRQICIMREIERRTGEVLLLESDEALFLDCIGLVVGRGYGYRVEFR